MRVTPIPQLADNYAYLVIDESTKKAGVVDCAEAEPVLRAVRDSGCQLIAILPTHHHWDHIGGNEDLLKHLKLEVYGYAGQGERIPGFTHAVTEGDTIRIGELAARIIFIPAHTAGHVAYYFEREHAVFTGDTLFAGGCGRLFEGDAAQMMASLAKLAALPDDTRVYCGHEYTEKNLRFAATLEPGNPALREKLAAVEKLRRAHRPTVPSTIGEEKATNPFLRTHSPELADAVRARRPDVPAGDPVALFAAVRQLKDRF